jgi:hypothetical protein
VDYGDVEAAKGAALAYNEENWDTVKEAFAGNGV